MATKKAPKPTFRELLTIQDGPQAGDHHQLYWAIFAQWPKSLVRNNITIATYYRAAMLSGEVDPPALMAAVTAYLNSTNYPCDLSKWMVEEGWRTYLEN